MPAEEGNWAASSFILHNDPHYGVPQASSEVRQFSPQFGPNSQMKERTMSIVGEWTLHYSWGCSGSYAQTTVTFAATGKFTTGDGYSGQWAVVGGNVQFVY